ncbi:MAG: sigma-54-dependent Fis family transcriptional regulator [bacterium]|nr:sigma-54-dependent Fis family transcriptional regulator [bacterium]
MIQDVTKLNTLLEISNIVHSTLEVNSVVNLILGTVTEALKADAGTLLLMNKDHQLYFRVTEKGEEIKNLKPRMEKDIEAWVATSGESVLIPERDKLGRFKDRLKDVVDFKIGSLICVPLGLEDKRIGSLEVVNKEGKPVFTEIEEDFLKEIAHHVVNSIRNAKLYAKASQENKGLKEILELKHTIIGESRSVKETLSLIGKVSGTKVSVLITGETGVGKELVARAIHENSPVKDGPFVEINCAAIPDTLLESELFGYEKGAFTGAAYTRKGKFELADGGTLFLDEIGSMSLMAQAKILRVLQERKFERVGGQRMITTDARIIAATNIDILETIKRGGFREDLYYRLNEINIYLLPLRDRKEDIPFLIEHFIEEFNSELNRDVKRVSDVAIKHLMGYEWFGNVRELRSAIKRAMILMEGDVIHLEHLPFEVRFISEEVNGGVIPSLEEMEREHILKALAYTDWNKTQTAQLLKISRPTLDKKIKTYGLVVKQK